MNNEKGFTLVELIIVIGILSVLTAIAIPNYFNYRHRASIRTDIATSAEIIRAARIYTIVNEGSAASITDILNDGFMKANEDGEISIIPLTSADAFNLSYNESTDRYNVSFSTDVKLVGPYGGKEYVITEHETLPDIS
ncbi:MAG: prepilin-type N-terminal cleavage/methylation domain-containing protein [Oscillospiraceae bacterium]|nr:prepilin-type N-terminal cleavage/methylation domain-containing protein [Oscillospiraceae bacterium]